MHEGTLLDIYLVDASQSFWPATPPTSEMRFLLFLLAVWLPLTQALTYKGADISSLINLENSGIRFFDGSTTATPFETIMKNHGANIARVRVWTSNSTSQYSLAYGLQMAKRIHAAGMSLMVDMHYSDTCA
jgi:arabinogalactan endo-1,4-beta-galactosidase